MAKSKQELLRLAAERFKIAYDADLDERSQADEDVRFGINDGDCQWNEAVKSMRQDDSPPRPCLTINLIPEKIDQIEGEFDKAEISYKVRPVDSAGDLKLADILGGMLRAIEYDSKARNAYNTSMTSTLYGGRGGWRWDVVEDEDDPWVKSLKISRIANIFTLYWDPYAKELDKSDAKWWFETEMMPNEEFKEKFGDKSLDDWPDGEMWESWRSDETRRIANYWWKDEVEVTVYRVKRGGKRVVVEELSGEDYNTADYEMKKVKRPKIFWCKMTANRILEGPHEDWPSKYFPFILQIGKEVLVKGKSKTRGMVRFAKEPQQLYNYAVSQITETFSLAPKAPYLLEADMLGDYKHIWDSANQKNYFYLPYKAPSANPQLMPQRQEPPAVNPSMFNVLSVIEHNLMGSMGVYQAKLGDRGDEKSGKAIFARQAQGTTGAWKFTSNFNAALQHSCRVGISLIPHVYDTERIVRIIGEDGIEREIPINSTIQGVAGTMPNVSPELMAESQEGLINDLGMGRYDVRVTVGPSYGTQRQEALEMLVELVGRVPSIAPAVLDLIAENMDLPKSAELVRRLKKLVPVEIRGLEPGEQPPPPPQPPPELMLKMEEIKIAMMDMQRKQFETMVNAVETIAKAESYEPGQQLNRYVAELKMMTEAAKIEQQRETAKQGVKQ